MEITFWGVRGSTPAPEREQWRFGGNTPCVTLRPSAPAASPSPPPLFILDAGTGIRELGRYLLSQFASPGLRAHLLFSHFHWDHVQGLPFFEPLYTYGNAFEIYGPRPQGRYLLSLQDTLEQLLQPPFFPAGPEALHAHREYHEIGEEKFEIEGVCISTRRLNHPQGALGYRFEADGTSVVYATDHEPGFPSFDHAVRELAWDADLLIADAHYLPAELGTKFRGWGHSTWAEAVRIARDANVKNLVLFHHEPARKDSEVDLILRDARRQFPHTWAASEQAIFTVEADSVRVNSRGRRLSQRHPAQRTVIFEGQENTTPFAEEAFLENLSFHGAYLLSRHRLDLQSPVRVLIESNDAANSNRRLALEGVVVRTDPARPAPQGSLLGGPSERYGIAIHFPGLPGSGLPEP